MQTTPATEPAHNAAPASPPKSAGKTSEPSQWHNFSIIRRNGAVMGFEPSKIAIAMTKAFLAVNGGQGAASARVRELVETLTAQVVNSLVRNRPSGGTFHIEEIQDQVELALMRSGEHDVARAYVLYREKRSQERARDTQTQAPAEKSVINVTDNGIERPLDLAQLRHIIAEAGQNLPYDIDVDHILKETVKNLYDGVPVDEVFKSAILSARALIETEPSYSQVASRLLLHTIRKEVLGEEATQADMAVRYAEYFPRFIKLGIENSLLDEKLSQYDLEKLAGALKHERDHQFTYLGLQTLYDRYFLHVHGRRIEMPQVFFMRVAMGLALNEIDREARAIEFYEVLSKFDFMSSTPTLFNSGTLHSQLSSCYLTTVSDDLVGIYDAIKENALLAKYAGGLGNDWTPVRALGAYIKGTNGKSQGVVPFLKVVNDTAVAVNQGGKRKGAVCAYLETWHLDIEEFIELRKNTGDDRRRTHDMNSANWIPDLFMKRVINEQEWTLFSPNDTPDLHDLYGEAFEARYQEYEAMTRDGRLKLYKRLPAINLWRKMLSMLFETGHPWFTFKDPCNLRSPQQHVGVVHSSNLCTEITLNTNREEIAVCNLGSVNLAQHVDENGLDRAKLERTINTAVRMLDNVIDINYYSVPQAKNSNMKHRPVGLGIMGFQDALYKQGIGYASSAAVNFADHSMEAVSYYAIQASARLAGERGAYQTFDGSLWSQGVLPIDSIDILVKQRGEQYCQVDRGQTLDWDGVRAMAKKGMRNSNVMAIAPTATIANITGVSQSIEPTYQNLYVKSNLSGEFTVVNPYLVKALKDRGLWDNVMVNDLKYYDGSVLPIDRVPADLKEEFRTAFEIEPRWLVEAASRRQKWIDQAQSLNLYIADANGKKLDVTYKMAWLLGLKTTYYLRAISATQTEKSTVNDNKLNRVSSGGGGASFASAEAASGLTEGGADFNQAADVPLACSLDDPDCEACQ
jgi:ribonucleoside-diphosphate reductase alpha chain